MWPSEVSKGPCSGEDGEGVQRQSSHPESLGPCQSRHPQSRMATEVYPVPPTIPCFCPLMR